MVVWPKIIVFEGDFPHGYNEANLSLKTLLFLIFLRDNNATLANIPVRSGNNQNFVTVNV